MSCDERAPMEKAIAPVQAGEEDPPCRTCGGILKSATISFGQGLVAEDLDRAQQAAARCDLMLGAGTKLSVFPIAGVVPVARHAGARVVIINAEPTDMDAMADAVLRGSIGGSCRPSQDEGPIRSPDDRTVWWAGSPRACLFLTGFAVVHVGHGREDAWEACRRWVASRVSTPCHREGGGAPLFCWRPGSRCRRSVGGTRRPHGCFAAREPRHGRPEAAGAGTGLGLCLRTNSGAGPRAAPSTASCPRRTGATTTGRVAYARPAPLPDQRSGQAGPNPGAPLAGGPRSILPLDPSGSSRRSRKG